MKWLFFSGVLLSVLLACSGKKNDLPGTVLPKDKMQAVLWDIMRADQFLGDYVLNKDSSVKKDSVRISYYRQILASYNITQEEFRESFSYYTSHPALMGSILDSMSKVKAPTTQVVVPVSTDSTRHDTMQRQSAIKYTPPVRDTFIPGKRVLKPVQQN